MSTSLSTDNNNPNYPQSPLLGSDISEDGLDNFLTSMTFGGSCIEDQLYAFDHRPVKAYGTFTGDYSVSNPDGLSPWWQGVGAVDSLIGFLNEDYALGFRRFMLYLPGGSRSPIDINPNHWYTLSVNKRSDLIEKIPLWLSSHEEVELIIYSGFLINPNIDNLSLTSINAGSAVSPEVSNIDHAAYLYENWIAWFDIGVKSIMFHDCASGSKAMAVKNLAYAYSLVGIKIRGNGIPVTGGLPNEYICETGWGDFVNKITALDIDNNWIFDPTITEIGVFLRSSDNLTNEIISLYASRGYVLYSFGGWFDEYLDDIYEDITKPIIEGNAGGTQRTVKGQYVFEIHNRPSNDAIKGFGYNRYNEIKGFAVGDGGDISYENYNVIAMANSVDGIFEFSNNLNKYTLLEIDIRNSQFDNTSLPHWVIEDTLEWVNSGLPSHLSQVQHSNIVNAGIVHERNFPGLKESISPSYQASFWHPCNQSGIDDIHSTIYNETVLNTGSLDVSLPYATSVIHIPEYNEVWVGGIGGVISINIDDKSILKIDLGKDLDIQNIVRFENSIYILSKNDLYIYDIISKTIKKDLGLGLPNNLYSFGISLSKILVIGGSDGLYTKKINGEDWTRVVDASKFYIISGLDSLFAVSGKSVWYSSDGLFWSNIGTFSDSLEINIIKKHRSQVYTGTSSGLYEDNGSFYSGSVSSKLIDILSDLIQSANISINSIDSNFDNAIFGLSDGRYVLYNGSYVVYEDSGLPVIHKSIFVGNDFWLFGYDSFKISNESVVRRLSTGVIISDNFQTGLLGIFDLN